MALAANPTNPNRVTKVKDIIGKLVSQHFSATLGREFDIINIVNALVYYESQHNVNAIGKPVSTGYRTGGSAYFNSSAVVSILSNSTTTPEQRANLNYGITAIGLMQVMGWNFVRGAAPSGQCELERLRPDIAGPLLVNPGEDILSKILGEANMEKAILAGLIMLEGKYRATNQYGKGFGVQGDQYRRTFITRLQGAVAAYLGLGVADRNGTTPEKYTNEIVGGATYAKANGKGSLYVRDSEIRLASTSGPGTNGSGLDNLKITGC